MLCFCSHLLHLFCLFIFGVNVYIATHLLYVDAIKGIVTADGSPIPDDRKLIEFRNVSTKFFLLTHTHQYISEADLLLGDYLFSSNQQVLSRT